ncbi:MAG: hypothetical protein WAV30_03990 [Microgenomates group bacterium]
MSENNQPSEHASKAGAYLAAIAMLGVKSYLAYYFGQEFPIPDDLLPTLYAVAGVIHIAGRVADDVATIKVFNKQRDFEESTGKKLGIKERMSLLPANPTAKDILHPGVLAMEVAEIIPIVINPLYGIGRGITSFIAAHNNNRISRSIDEGMGKR